MTNETHTYLAAAEVCGLGQTRNSVLLLLAWGRERAPNVISVGLLSLSFSGSLQLSLINLRLASLAFALPFVPLCTVAGTFA